MFQRIQWSLLALVLFASNLFGEEFCVQTLNTYGIRRKSDLFEINLSYRMDKIIQKIKKDRCHITLMQEIWRPLQTKVLDQLKEDDRHITHYKASTSSDYNLGLSNVLIGKLNNHRESVFINRVSGKREFFKKLISIGKGYAFSNLTTEEGNNIDIYNIHLQNTIVHKGEKIKEESLAVAIAQTLELVDNYFENLTSERAPLIIAGDVNNLPGSITTKIFSDILLLKDSYTEQNGPYSTDSCTFCGPDNGLVMDYDRELRLLIDYVLYRDGGFTSLSLKSSKQNFKLIPTGNSPINKTAKKGNRLTLRISRRLGQKDKHFNFFSDHYGVQSRFELLPHAPEQVSQITYEKRIAKAMKTLEEAEGQVRKYIDSRHRLKKTLSIIKRIEKRLKDTDKDSPVTQYFLQK